MSSKIENDVIHTYIVYNDFYSNISYYSRYFNLQYCFNYFNVKLVWCGVVWCYTDTHTGPQGWLSRSLTIILQKFTDLTGGFP